MDTLLDRCLPTVHGSHLVCGLIMMINMSRALLLQKHLEGNRISLGNCPQVKMAGASKLEH
jgi:hypothetical protein